MQKVLLRDVYKRQMFDLLDKAMWGYIIKDIGKELEYLPYALFLGIIVYFVFKIILRKNSKPDVYKRQVVS